MQTFSTCTPQPPTGGWVGVHARTFRQIRMKCKYHHSMLLNEIYYSFSFMYYYIIHYTNTVRIYSCFLLKVSINWFLNMFIKFKMLSFLMFHFYHKVIIFISLSSNWVVSSEVFLIVFSAGSSFLIYEYNVIAVELELHLSI